MASQFIDRLSSLDSGYLTGELSLYPIAQDSKNTLYEVKNNAETFLIQGLIYTSKFLVVDSTSLFPSQGLLRVGTELIYYNSKTTNTFRNLKRGFAGSRQSVWSSGTTVLGSVISETHNAVKDAMINIEINLGVEINPAPASLNGILTTLETRFLSPLPIIRAFPISGVPPLTVKFQNFSGGDPIRYLWDFGDGGTSIEISPVHVYSSEGIYTVKLNMITSLGAQGVVTKSNYITVNNSEKPAFFYVDPLIGTTATTFNFVDQTDGSINSRYWIFDDGDKQAVLDPNIHTTTHTYTTAGTYNPTLIVVFQDKSLKRLVLSDFIIVT